MKAPRPCPLCGATEALQVEYTAAPIPVRHLDYAAYCACYDGAPDAGPQPQGSGASAAEAVAAWHEHADCWEDEREATGGWVCQACGRGVVEDHECEERS